MCKVVEIREKGDALRNHRGIKNLIKKNPVYQFLPKKCHSKENILV
jgi:hypothetical protein